MIYKQNPDVIVSGDAMSCQECGHRTVRNGRESTKMRGAIQNFCVRGVVNRKKIQISTE